MDAHVQLWGAGEPDVRCDDRAAHDLTRRLRALPGFRSYAVVDTGQAGVATVTVFEKREQLAPLAKLLREPIAPTAARASGHQRGEVLFRVTAWDGTGAQPQAHPA